MARWRRAGLTFSLTAAAALLLGSGCSEDGTVSLDSGAPDGGYDTVCGPNLKPYGPACVPILDDCPDNHVPVPGGGCKRVGVEECSIDGVPGIKGPPDWTCKRIGVVECKTSDGGPGIKGPPDWTCKAIGPPTKCLAGWAKGADGWCEPILPKTKCPAGTMEVIGKTTCQPVGDCGTGKWGEIVLTPKTVFVDAAYQGGDADGSQAKPFPTIGQALQATGRDAHIAVAEGEYKEDLLLDKALVLEGRCAAKVRIVGQDPQAAVTVLDAVTIRGLGITGPGRGILIKDGKALVEAVEVARCGDIGVTVQQAGAAADRAAGLTLRDSLVASNRGRGIWARGTAVVIERSVVRDTRPEVSTNLLGNGIYAESWGSQPAKVEVRDSVLANNRHAAILVEGATVVERSVVRDTRPQASDGQAGIGVVAVGGKKQASLEVRDSLVANNHTEGIVAQGAAAVVERSVVRDTRPRAADKQFGWGIFVSTWQGQPASLVLRHSLVSGNHAEGIQVTGATAVVERSIVQDTRLQAGDGLFGYGFGVGPLAGQPVSLALRDSLVWGNRSHGIMAAGAAVTVERSIVRDNQGLASDKQYVGGVCVFPLQGQPATLALRDSLVSGNHLYGVEVDGSTAVVERSVLRDTKPYPSDKSWGHGIAAVSHDGLVAALDLTDSLVSSNQFIGVSVFDADATIRRCIVRSTQLGREPTEGVEIGTGIHVWNQQSTRKLLLQDTLVAGNHVLGVGVFDTPKAVVERCVVRDTRPTGDGMYGMGINAGAANQATRLDLSDSVIAENRVAGISVANSSVKVQRCLVQNTSPGKAEVVLKGPSPKAIQDGWGEGLLVGTYPDSPFSAALDLEDTLVENSARAGVFVGHATGTVRRSVLRKGVFSVVLDNAQVEVGEDNVFEDNTENRVTYTENLPQVAPIPIPPSPSLGNP